MDLSSLLLLISAPVFLLGMALEVLVLRFRKRPSYDRRDSAVSITTALINQALTLPWAFVEIALLVWLCGAVPWHLHGWAAWIVAMIAVDFAFYWYHRTHHQIRLLWAVHVVHHSSQQYNLSVALRQPWAVFTTLPFLVPVALLGIDARIILACYGLNLLYQFFLHTEIVDKLWAPIEFVFNTPSHHRVHHGSQPQYLDTNYGGILIIWDRMFGSFQPERERVRYGLTKNIATNNIAAVETHEFVAIWRSVRTASNWRDRLGYVLRGPGWAPVPTGALAPSKAKPLPVG
ncbi:sterol desaturase family protein [Mycobacterium vicinigordonae]|uniref:Sterol desaturase family protein n=1 Tax=Mycobacterium vicinigordonae TaxID=1719132 RepID=A0A7D6DZ07_9MYCO|nr:sterol desaturase family protein [Mycobacterium vicinigordonae]QLL06950.1 sterol desaturase family protein [Mycobacterium vicinigordonae]